MITVSKTDQSTPELKGSRRSQMDLLIDVLRVTSTQPVGVSEMIFRANLSYQQAQRITGLLLDFGYLEKVPLGGKRVGVLITPDGKKHLDASKGRYGTIGVDDASVWDANKKLQALVSVGR